MAHIGDRQGGRNLQLLAEHGVPALTEPALVQVLQVKTAITPGRVRLLSSSTRADRAARDVAAQERRVQHAGYRDVVDVLTVSGQQAVVFLAGDRSADVSSCWAGRWSGSRYRCGRHREAFISFAALRTARRIP